MKAFSTKLDVILGLILVFSPGGRCVNKNANRLGNDFVQRFESHEHGARKGLRSSVDAVIEENKLEESAFENSNDPQVNQLQRGAMVAMDAMECDCDVPPLITCPAHANVSCDQSWETSALGRATGVDRCDNSKNVTIDWTDKIISTGSCEDDYVMARTWSATDSCNNVGTCDQLIKVIDDVEPLIACPADATVDCAESWETAALGRAMSVDTCERPVTIAWTDSIINASAHCADEFVVARTWSSTDNCGNVATCDQHIYVNDTNPPLIMCPNDVTIECDQPRVDLGTSQSVDACERPVNITYSDGSETTPLSCADNFVITRKWTSTDGCGNPATCDQFITLEDTTAPTIDSGAKDLTVECDGGGEEEAWLGSNGGASASDNCGNITWSNNFASLEGCGNAGSATVTFTAADDCDNTVTTSATFTVEDTQDPVITCPADVTVQCDSSTDPSVLGEAVASDRCDSNVAITMSENISDEYCDPYLQVITRTWTATDDCGNTASCDQVIIVVDDTPPEISCPADVTVECGQPTDPSALGRASATDNCDTDPAISFDDSDFNLFCDPDVKLITRTWSVIDDCYNTDSCVQQILVSDTLKPKFVEDELPEIVLECGQGLGDVDYKPEATDECTEDVRVIVESDVFADGAWNRTWMAEDFCGHRNFKAQIIRSGC